MISSRTITPKLTIYVCRENACVYNAIYLTSHTTTELYQKISTLVGVSLSQVRDIYMEGPQAIHVQLNNDVIRHIKNETMFSLEIIQDNGSFVFVLKNACK